MNSVSSKKPKVVSEENLRLRQAVAENIRKWAQLRGLSINILADRSGVSRAQMFNVLRTTSSPSLDWINRVAPVLGIPAWRLLVEAEETTRAFFGEEGEQHSTPVSRPSLAPNPNTGWNRESGVGQQAAPVPPHMPAGGPQPPRPCPPVHDLPPPPSRWPQQAASSVPNVYPTTPTAHLW